MALCARGIPHLERALALKPNLIGALGQLGIAYFARYRSADAIACYRRALAIDPDMPDVLTNLGEAPAPALRPCRRQA